MDIDARCLVRTVRCLGQTLRCPNPVSKSEHEFWCNKQLCELHVLLRQPGTLQPASSLVRLNYLNLYHLISKGLRHSARQRRKAERQNHIDELLPLPNGLKSLVGGTRLRSSEQATSSTLHRPEPPEADHISLSAHYLSRP